MAVHRHRRFTPSESLVTAGNAMAEQNTQTVLRACEVDPFAFNVSRLCWPYSFIRITLSEDNPQHPHNLVAS